MKVRSAWLNDPIVIAGNWEPLAFKRRLGGCAANLDELYAYEHTPEFADSLKKAGITLLITHWFKGFGFKAEAEDMAAARTLIQLCHERGIKVGGYVGDTFICETMLNEEADAAGWCQRKADGTPITFGGAQIWRWKWCRNNPAFLEYMKEVLRLGIEAGLDMIHFDNFLNKPEPKTCRCRHCANQFRKFLEDKYPEADRKRRFGFGCMANVEPPWSTTQLYVRIGEDCVSDPLWQEWIEFRCKSLTRSYADLAAICRSLKADIAIECNPTGIWGENSADLRSVNHAELLPHGDFFWDESPNPFGLLDNGAISTNLRSMKLGESLGNRSFFYSFGRDCHSAALHLGEALAANDGCIGMIGIEGPTAGRCREFVNFLGEHRSLLCGSSSTARVAVYRNFASLAYDSWNTHLQTILAEQALLEGNIPFDFVFELGRAAGYSVLVVAGMECLSEDEILRLRTAAASGTKVVLVGRVGKYDQWRRRRPVLPFADDSAVTQVPELLLPPHGPSKSERQVWDDYYSVVDARFWICPANSGEFLKHMPHDFGVEAPPAVLVISRLAADRRTLLFHCLDYDANRTEPAKVAITMPAEAEGPVSLLMPGKPAEALRAGKKITFQMSEAYQLLALSAPAT